MNSRCLSVSCRAGASGIFQRRGVTLSVSPSSPFKLSSYSCFTLMGRFLWFLRGQTPSLNWCLLVCLGHHTRYLRPGLGVWLRHQKSIPHSSGCWKSRNFPGRALFLACRRVAHGGERDRTEDTLVSSCKGINPIVRTPL